MDFTTRLTGAIFVASLLVLQSVEAFWPLNLGRTRDSATHQSITESALRRVSVGATAKAVGEVTLANAGVDIGSLAYDDAHWHVDGETFDEAHARIKRLRERCVALMTACPPEPELARRSVGAALHTLQDFYSHSTWVELGNTDPHPSFSYGGSGELKIHRCLSTCMGSELIGAGLERLTSGYFGGQDVLPPDESECRGPIEKCIHGGMHDTLGWLGINKDDVDSPHGVWHHSAARIAEEATVMFLESINSRLSGQQIDMLYGIDERLLPPTRFRLSSASGGHFLVLVNINDLGFHKELLISPGGFEDVDLPECAPFTSLLRLSVARDPKYPQESERTIEYNVSFFKDWQFREWLPLICCQMPSPNWTISGTLRASEQFHQFIVEATSTPVSAADIMIASALQPILHIVGNRPDTNDATSFSVESGVPLLFLSSSNATPALIRPNGSIVRATDVGVERRSISAVTEYWLTNPPAGSWSLRLEGDSNYSAQVSVSSPIALHGIELVQYMGRPGHEGFFPISAPLADRTNFAVVSLYGPTNAPEFELRTPDGKIMARSTVDITTANGMEQFFGGVQFPAEPILFYVKGNDSNGYQFQRVHEVPLVPQTLVLQGPVFGELPAGRSTTNFYRITNLGPPGAFSFSASDTREYVLSHYPSNAFLLTGEATNVQVRLRPPYNTPASVVDEVSLVVQSLSGADVKRSTSLRMPVFRPEIERHILVRRNSAGQINISWQGGALQHADDLGGPWLYTPNASPPYITSPTNAHRFYRVNSD